MKILEILIPFIIKESAEMLDISILNADKVVMDKNKKVDTEKAQQFLNQNFTVEEKADGTKLTLYRNDRPFNPNDYTKNWIVAYKNQIIWPEEFDNLNRSEIKKLSIGYAQYALVHDHLKSVQGQLSEIPNNTEFFVEFIQNKPTTTRDYERYNDMWLISYSPAKASISNGLLKTNPTGYFTDKNAEYAKVLGLGLPPVVFQGNPSTAASFQQGIRSKELQDSFDKHISEFETDPYTAVKNTFLGMSSVLGGKPEGVVLKNESGKFYKFVQSDQYDKELRMAKKLRYKGSQEEENTYFEKVKEVAQQLIAQSKATDVATKLKEVAALVYKLPPTTLTHPKKDWFKIQEDLMVTIRQLILQSATTSSAVFVGRFQPFQNGHKAIIDKALQEHDHLYVVFVKGEQIDPKDNPFDFNLQTKMINAMGYGDRVSVVIAPTGKVVGNAKEPGFLNIINDPSIKQIYFGPDRDYAQQVQKANLSIKAEPESEITGAAGQKTRATEARNALLNNDREKFQSLTPQPIWAFYDELKAKIDQVYGRQPTTSVRGSELQKTDRPQVKV